jgi:hypothetical protein
MMHSWVAPARAYLLQGENHLPAGLCVAVHPSHPSHMYTCADPEGTADMRIKPHVHWC